ncbi:MAG: hypothetical protein IJX71_05380, partial [Oscillospiraceae bacterium]|nr:hypothetical protein [Oscillospiraceae bacterium]
MAYGIPLIAELGASAALRPLGLAPTQKALSHSKSNDKTDPVLERTLFDRNRPSDPGRATPRVAVAS